MFSLEYYSDDVQLKQNQHGKLGIIAVNQVDKGDIICQFPLSILAISDGDIFHKLKESMGTLIPDNQLSRFTLALNILYHPKKYDVIHKRILQNYSPYKPFLFRDNELKFIKDTCAYYLITTEKLYFDLMMTQYRHMESDINYDAEHKLKVIYSFCTSCCHNIDIAEKSLACIGPFSYMNSTYCDKYPKLSHQVENGKWTIYAEKDYAIGDEIMDSYRLTIQFTHPYYKNLVFTDWKIPTIITNGIIYDKTIYNDELGYKLKDNINETKINMIDKIYNNIDTDELKKTTGDKRYMGCLDVIVNILEIEKEYYNKFKNKLDENTTSVNLEIV
jgi:hypothetical protein